jgi:hypothetical protein
VARPPPGQFPQFRGGKKLTVSIFDQVSTPPLKMVCQRRYLVHDLIEDFQSRKGDTHRFRIRVWLGIDATPVVIVSGVNSVDPSWMSVTIANWVHSALLRYPASGVLYFEAYRPRPQDDTESSASLRLRQVHFEYVGHKHRARLIKPTTSPAIWSALEYVVGDSIEV